MVRLHRNMQDERDEIRETAPATCRAIALGKRRRQS